MPGSEPHVDNSATGPQDDRAGPRGPPCFVRILALQLKRIGDLVLTTPALSALKSAGAHVTLVVMDGTAALSPMLEGTVDAMLVYRSQGGNRTLWKQIWRGGFDACVDFTGRDRSALMTLVSRAAIRVIARPALRKSRWRRLCYNAVADAPVRSRHTVDHYLDHLAPLQPLLPSALPDDPAAGPVLHLSPEAAARAAQTLAAHHIGANEEFFVVHPGSARPEKYWRPERWAEVIAFCQGTLQRRCVLTGGSGDPTEIAHLACLRTALATLGQSCVDLTGQLDLTTLAAVLSRARLFLGVDSGPVHLAAAWRRPQIVLFGPTNPFHWRPRHPGGLVLQAGHGDVPVREFAERSPGGPLDLISTRAVIDCIAEATEHAP